MLPMSLQAISYTLLTRSIALLRSWIRDFPEVTVEQLSVEVAVRKSPSVRSFHLLIYADCQLSITNHAVYQRICSCSNQSVQCTFNCKTGRKRRT